MRPNLQHAIERVGRPGGSHEGVGRKKSEETGSAVTKCGDPLFWGFNVSGVSQAS